MTREQANRFLYKIYRALKNNTVKFKLSRKLGRLYGALDFLDWDRAVMQVHPQKKQFMGTLLHECVHLVDTERKEQDVLEIESQLMKHLTDRQLLNLLKKVVLHCTKRL